MKAIGQTILSAREAFDLYGPNDDRFYTSQGLNPEEQKRKTQKLNDATSYEKEKKLKKKTIEKDVAQNHVGKGTTSSPSQLEQNIKKVEQVVKESINPSKKDTVGIKQVHGNKFVKGLAIGAAILGSGMVIKSLTNEEDSQQTAKDISQYRYGKKMHGYMQG